jgi:glycerol-3-phosphate dehydrogenase
MRRGRGRSPEVLVIGGGTTGTGIARDLAMRGAGVLLVEAGDLCAGASGANHGMLHSGARYAVRDPQAAWECATESKVLKRIAAYCIEDHGGMFVALPGDDPDYRKGFTAGCRQAEVGAEEITLREAKEREPNLSPDIVAAIAVPDAAVDPFFLVWGNAESARQAGAEVRTHCPVVSMEVRDGRIARTVIGRGRERTVIMPELVINASGAWCGHTAALAGAHIDMQMDAGTMVVLNGRALNGLVNRLRPPGDGDIVVPHRSSTILGTTSRKGHLGRIGATREEVDILLAEGTAMVPGISSARTVRAYTGIRPLPAENGDGRAAPRGFSLIDHTIDGVDNLISVVGGKMTTYRLMAEKVSDAAMSWLGTEGSCRTMIEEVLPPTSAPEGFAGTVLSSKYGGQTGTVLAACHRSPLGMDEACTCEAVHRGELEHFASSPDVRSCGDLMRRTRAGMGFCQGGLCAFHLACALEGDPIIAAERFLAERWKGVAPVLRGDQLRQEAFKAHLFRSHGIDHSAEEDR